MDLLQDRVKPIYFKYLTAAFGSALISAIYGVVDMAMVGQYHGPEGSAAMAVVAPVWNIIYSLGLLMGIGGSVLLSTLRGESARNRARSNEYFTAAVLGTAILAAAAWLGLICFDRQLLRLFGAGEALMPLARRYVFPVKFAVPVFLFTQVLSAFLRNDGDPGRATRAVLFGGVFNVFGDYFFVFALDMGIQGAGLATVIGASLSLLVMLGHFRRAENTLRLARPSGLWAKLRKIAATGFSTFFIDVAMGILTVLFNRQILRYLCTEELSVYGILINISTFVQCSAYSIGQAAQPILSMNYGAGKGARIRQTLCAGDGVSVRRAVDGGVPRGAESVRAGLHEADRVDSRNRAGNHPAVCHLVSSAAGEHLFDLLLSGADAAAHGVSDLRGARRGRQRRSDLPAAGARGRVGDLVCHARHGAVDRALRDGGPGADGRTAPRRDVKPALRMKICCIRRRNQI